MKCIVVDDEPLAREGLKRMIQQNPFLDLIAVFASTEGVSSFIHTNQIELVFLDIEMPGATGLEFAGELPDGVLVIFTTAYPQYALESYEIDAVDYLVKPLEQARLDKAINRAKQHSELLKSAKNAFESIEEQHIIVRADRRFIKINFGDILFIAGLKDYVIIHTVTERVITLMNLKNIHLKLPQDQFLRISKSYVVNKAKVTSFDSNTIYIQDNELSIGKSYQSEFFKSFFN
jgi:DNA-binding LytR/AlgR family response regulator